jgi:sugar lactone lactonase YvrE
MKLFDPQSIWPVQAELGEGPLWLSDTQQLYFVDIRGQQIHQCDAQGQQRRSWSVPQRVGFVQPLADPVAGPRGRLIAGLKDGLYRFEEGRLVMVLQPEENLPVNRLNDACTDRHGHLWFGSMDDGGQLPTGSLYRVDADGQARVHDSGISITNGPCFSPDGKTFYHTDTMNHGVFAFDVTDAGTLQRKRLFARIQNGLPDGSTVDAAGHVWVALYAGHRIERYSPDGRLVQSVPLPCPNVTKMAFGGPDGCTAFVTTAWQGMRAAQRAQYPLAGNLFSFRSDTPGLPQHRITQGFEL